MTFDFESLSAKVGPLLRIDLSQEGHGEKKISEICFFSSKNVGFCQKVLPEKVFPASRPPKFLSRGTPGDEKKLEKKICQKVKNIFKSVAAIRQVLLKSLFSFKTMKNIFFQNGKNLQKTSNWKNNYFNFLQFFHFRKNTISFMNGTA